MIIKNWVREYFNREKAFNNTFRSIDEEKEQKVRQLIMS